MTLFTINLVGTVLPDVVGMGLTGVNGSSLVGDTGEGGKGTGEGVLGGMEIKEVTI